MFTFTLTRRTSKKKAFRMKKQVRLIGLRALRLKVKLCGAEVQLHSFLTWALDVGQSSTSGFSRFTPGKNFSKVTPDDGQIKAETCVGYSEKFFL
jgi:hypothetical protein